MSKHEKVNHSNQMNPNNNAYWESRGWDGRPDDWEARAARDETTKQRKNYQVFPKYDSQPSSYSPYLEEWLGKTAANPRYSYIEDDDE